MKAITRFLKTALVLAVIVVGGAIAYAYSGFYDISVGTGHNAVTHWYLATLRNNSIERRAADLQVPALDGEETIRAGALSYDQSCSGCHGRPGREPSASFDPAPPALTRYEYDPAEVFWVVRNGIKMSAMPARGEDRMSDQQVWEVAAFMQVAPSLTEGEYREMVEPPPPPPDIEPVPETGEADVAEDGEEDGSEPGGEDEGQDGSQPADAQQDRQPAADDDNDG